MFIRHDLHLTRYNKGHLNLFMQVLVGHVYVIYKGTLRLTEE